MSVPYENTGSIDCSATPNLDNIKGKSVIVTGGSSGLGEAYVKAFLDAGYLHQVSGLDSS
jgi:FlaA1/EpsC-like NDP-sugar epimerase